MASGYTVTGRGDLDAIFAPPSGAHPADTGYKVAGVDIANRYRGRAGTLAAASTGYKVNGQDLSIIFMDINVP